MPKQNGPEVRASTKRLVDIELFNSLVATVEYLQDRVSGLADQVEINDRVQVAHENKILALEATLEEEEQMAGGAGDTCHLEMVHGDLFIGCTVVIEP